MFTPWSRNVRWALSLFRRGRKREFTDSSTDLPFVGGRAPPRRASWFAEFVWLAAPGALIAALGFWVVPWPDTHWDIRSPVFILGPLCFSTLFLVRAAAATGARLITRVLAVLVHLVYPAQFVARMLG